MKASEYTFSCSECGAIVSEEEKKCPDCGADLSEFIDKTESDTPYQSLEFKSALLTSLLIVILIISTISILIDIGQINLVKNIIDGNNVSEVDITSNDSKIQIMGVIFFLSFLITTIVFLNWKYRAHKNLSPLQAFDKEYSSGWAVGAYFVPIMNLVRPYKIMREIWKGSDPNYTYFEKGEGNNWKDAPSTILIILWWISFLVDNLMAYYHYTSSTYLFTIKQIYDYSITFLISDLAVLPPTILLIILVNRINKRQERKNKIINKYKEDRIPDEKSEKQFTKDQEINLDDYEEIEDSDLSDEEKAKLYGNVLGLKGRVKKSDIIKIYKRMIEKYHPDKVNHLGDEFQRYAEKKTKDINKAFLYFKKKYNL